MSLEYSSFNSLSAYQRCIGVRHRPKTHMHAIWLDYLNAFRNVTRQSRRSLFGIAAIICGVIALLLAAGFIEWIFWATREGTIQTGLGHIHAVRSGYLQDGQADPTRFLIAGKNPMLQSLQQTPAVTAVGRRLAFSGLVSKGDSSLSFVGEGVEPTAEQQISSMLVIVSGQNLADNDPTGILLGQGLARNLGAQVGDTVVLLSTTVSGSMNAVECHVRGLFNTVSKAYDDSSLRAPLPTVQKLMRTDGAHRWIMVLKDTSLTASTVATLRKQYTGNNFEFAPWYELADFYNKMVPLLSMQVGVIEFIIAAIIVLSISNTMSMSVLERTAEIGTSLAMGRRRRQILSQFIYEGLTIGLLGGLLGLILGTLLALAISWIGIPMPPPPGMSQGYTGEILITPALALRALLLALITSLLASLYPAWKASRLEIVDALRHNR